MPDQGLQPTGAPAPLSVAIVEDRREIRENLRVLIDGTEGFRCVGAFASMEEGLGGLDRNLPQVLLLDIELPGMSGIEGMRILRQRHPALNILILTVYEDDDRVMDALCAGACGYLLKRTSPARLIESIREAATGGAPMSPEIARRVIALFQTMRPPSGAGYDLTPHEIRILRLLVEGHNYKTAAVELGVSVNTIATHIKRIYEKLEVHSKSEAVSKALRSHLIR